MENKGFVIGLTGPTGAGKSTVAKELESLGCRIVDCDRIARRITDTCAPCREALQEEFGADIFREGVLDRKLLAQRAFASPEKTQRLNGITHPWILRETQAQVEAGLAAGARAVVIDAPLLFEAGADRFCQKILAVTVPYEKRLRRIIARDNITEEQARARMDAQHPESWYEARADWVVSGSMDDAALRGILEKHLAEGGEEE